jgi:hypothetical protein
MELMLNIRKHTYILVCLQQNYQMVKKIGMEVNFSVNRKPSYDNFLVLELQVIVSDVLYFGEISCE